MTLVERDCQLSLLQGLLAECGEGDGRVAVISGPVSSGKTELITTFAAQATTAGATFLTAIAARAEQAVPFGVVGQLFRTAALAADTAAHLTALLNEAAVATLLGDLAPAAEPVVTPVPHRLAKALQDLIEQTPSPLVIAVDDIHYADIPSLHCLAYLVRRLRTAPVLLVVTESTRPLAVHTVFHSELPPEPHCRHVQLGPLSEDGVSAVLAQRLDQRTARLMASDYHAVSGGNLLLLRGLIDDFHTSGPAQPPTVTVGTATGQALLSVLHRCEPCLLQVARGVAVLDQSATDPHLGRLLGLRLETAARGVNALNAAGILSSGRFRHPQARAAVLDAMPHKERTDLHARAAFLLHEDGAPATAVAEQLLAAEIIDGPCAVGVLHEAAEQSLADGELAMALRYLRMAMKAPATERQQATTSALLARAEWRVNPATALRHLPDLVNAARSHHLDGQLALAPVAGLLWFGQLDAALDVLGHVEQAPEPSSGQTAPLTHAIRLWLSLAYPSVEGSRCQAEPADERSQLVPATTSAPLRGVLVLHRALTRGPSGQTNEAAGQLLRECRLEGDTLALIAAAVLTLILGDQFSTAESWCERFIAEARNRHAPTWHGIFAALGAEAALRRGDLVVAEAHAQTALAVTPPRSWGMGIGLPLSVLLEASTALGRGEEALHHLQVPVPEAMFQTPIGLLYLRARGRYHRAQGQLQSAIDAFQSIGELMTRWRLDRPALVPWRTELAETYLRMGRDQQARKLAVEQLDQLGTGQPRSRAAALRVLAAASEPQQRLALLNQAVEALRPDEDILELGHTLADLGRRYQEVGRFGQARMMLQRAYDIARQCGAESLRRALLPDVPDDEPPAEVGEELSITDLSDAERRVAVLAARGYTNRQIAKKLYVTVSTVEQHLTRVYRKLKVNRRTDLLVELHQETVAPVPAGAGSGPRDVARVGPFTRP
jgi:DNA-binding CsgD family transcriptional regulator